MIAWKKALSLKKKKAIENQTYLPPQISKY